MKTLLSLLILSAATVSSAFAGTTGPYVTEVVGTMKVITTSGSTSTTVAKPLSKATICQLVERDPSKHVLVFASNALYVVDKATRAPVAVFMQLGSGATGGSNNKGSYATGVSILGSDIGSFVGNYRKENAALFSLNGNFQGYSNIDDTQFFIKGKMSYVKPYNLVP